MDQDQAHVQVGEALEGGRHHPPPLLLVGLGKDLRPLTQGSPGLLDPLDVVAVYLDLLDPDLLGVLAVGSDLLELDQLEVL